MKDSSAVPFGEKLMGSAIFHKASQLVTPLIVTAVPKDEIMYSFQRGLSMERQASYATLALFTFISSPQSWTFGP